MTFQIIFSIYQKYSSLRHWLNLTFILNDKPLVIFKITTCNKVKMFKIFNRLFKFGKIERIK